MIYIHLRRHIHVGRDNIVVCITFEDRELVIV